MLTCDNMVNSIRFVIERVKVDLGRLKVFADRREPETSPVYFKSKFLPHDQEGRERQIEFETALVARGLFEAGAPEPGDRLTPLRERCSPLLTGGGKCDNGASRRRPGEKSV